MYDLHCIYIIWKTRKHIQSYEWKRDGIEEKEANKYNEKKLKHKKIKQNA